MQGHGVRTLFLETSNYHWPSALNRPDAMSALIETGPRARPQGRRLVPAGVQRPGQGLQAVAWRRSRFRSAAGQKFDSFTLDIEASIVKDVDTRNSRLRTLSNRIRAAVGASYPLGACIPSPAGMAKNASYWPRLPLTRRSPASTTSSCPWATTRTTATATPTPTATRGTTSASSASRPAGRPSPST